MLDDKHGYQNILDFSREQTKENHDTQTKTEKVWHLEGIDENPQNFIFHSLPYLVLM